MSTGVIRHYLFSRRNRALRGTQRAGIAIGVILFVVVMLGVIAMVVAAGTGDFGSASIADRISGTIPSQAILIRTKINACNTQYNSTLALCNTTGTCPGAGCELQTGAACAVDPANTDPYPLSTSSGTDVSALLCDPMGTVNLWTADNTLVPTPVPGFSDWYYIDAEASGGGRCIWTEPTSNNPSGDAAFVNGLTKATQQFSSGTSYSDANEVIYDPLSNSQKFVMWITMPTGTPSSYCLP